MPRITISIPDEVLRKFKEQFPEINVAELSRRAITEKIRELKEFEKLKIKGRLQ